MFVGAFSVPSIRGVIWFSCVLWRGCYRFYRAWFAYRSCLAGLLQWAKIYPRSRVSIMSAERG